MKKVHVNLAVRGYDIIIGGGLLPELGKHVRAILFPESKECIRTAIITDENVAELYLSTVEKSLLDEGFETLTVIVPAGENSKSLGELENIYTKLIENHFERGHPVIALGGGVIGDLGGFTAATFLRGVPYVQVPTTLLAQVDSSVGGKVAVNHEMGKNLIGSFYQPLLVLTDVNTLRTLPEREMISGIGEVIKHGMIRDASLFADLEKNFETILSLEFSRDMMESLIKTNCRIKAGVVERDEHEAGERAHLNYGHTIGHTIEALTGYGEYSHGMAVLLGMVAAGEIAHIRNMFPEKDQMRQDILIRRVLKNITPPKIAPDSIIEKIRLDKKVKDGIIRFILPERIGIVRIVEGVEPEEIKQGINHMVNFLYD